jgi:hypothetical protein
MIKSRRMLAQILPLLADFESDPIQAAHLRRQAKEFQEYLISHSPPELRATAII